MSDAPALCHTANLIVAVLGQSGLARSVAWVDLQHFIKHRIQDRNLDLTELACDRQALMTVIAWNGNRETIDLVERELYHQPGIRNILLALLKSGKERPIRTTLEYLEGIDAGPAEWPPVPSLWLAPPPLKGREPQGDHDDVDKYLHRRRQPMILPKPKKTSASIQSRLSNWPNCVTIFTGPTTLSISPASIENASTIDCLAVS